LIAKRSITPSTSRAWTSRSGDDRRTARRSSARARSELTGRRSAERSHLKRAGVSGSATTSFTSAEVSRYQAMSEALLLAHLGEEQGHSRTGLRRRKVGEPSGRGA